MTYFDTWMQEYRSIGVSELYGIEYNVVVLRIGQVENRAACFLAGQEEKIIYIHRQIPIYQILSRHPHVCHLSHELFAVKLINRFIPMNQTCGATF